MKTKQLQEILTQKKCDVLFFFNMSSLTEDINLTYLTGYARGAGVLIVQKNKKPLLLAPKMEVERAKKGHVKNVQAFDKKKFFESIEDKLKSKKKGLRIGIVASSISLQIYKAMKKQFKGATVIDISEEMQHVRAKKEAFEVKIMQQAFKYANAVYEKTIKNFRDFKTESDVAAYMQYETAKKNCDLSFPTIVASGKHASMAHAEPYNTKLQRGLCVIDFGIRYKHYCTDMTRTVAIGKINNQEKQAYADVLKVQKQLVRSANVGTSCSWLYNECVRLLGSRAQHFTHALGHGIGVAVHELPNLSPNSAEKLQKGTAVTIEPGVYLPTKYGIRIEDTIMLTNKKQILTRPTKELITVR